MPVGVNLMISQVLYRAAQVVVTRLLLTDVASTQLAGMGTGQHMRKKSISM